MSVRAVNDSIRQLTADGDFKKSEIPTLMQAAGAADRNEAKAIRDFIASYRGTFEPGAKTELNKLLGQMPRLRTTAAQINAQVTREEPVLSADIKARLGTGATKTFGGTVIPDAVKAVINQARANGKLVYDVRQQKADPVYDNEHGPGTMSLDGQFNPYSQQQNADDTLAFDKTELTPKGIEEDMTKPQTWMEIAGYQQIGGVDSPILKQVTGTGSGHISELYDEASWSRSQTFARGPGGDKYASNFAILADGSLHCVPASRRSAADPDMLILTTASLARGKQMMFNGHLHMDEGVVTYVGLSGRLGKNNDNVIDAVEVLKAWGFKLAPGLTVTQE